MILTPEALEKDFGAEQNFLKTEYRPFYNKKAVTPAEGITELWLTEARSEMLADMQLALGLDATIASDEAALQAIIDKNGMTLTRALVAKQLFFCYDDLSGAKDSRNDRKRSEYEKKYANLQSTFQGLDSTSLGAQTESARIYL